MCSRRKKILIDANSVIPYYLKGYLYGIGRSTMELLRALDKLTSDKVDIEVCTQNIHGVKIRFLEKLKYHHLYLSNKRIFKKISKLLQLKKHLFGYALYHIPHNTDECEDLSKTIFTIHDLIVYHYPEMWGLTDKEKNEFKNLANKCRHIVTCSEASKKDIVKFWEVNPEKVTVVPWGINREIFRNSKDMSFLKQKGIEEGYIFCASCNHPRKNVPYLLEGYRRYFEQGGQSQLVLLAPIKDQIKDYEDLLNSNKIKCLYGISDSELVSLYSGAKVSVVPSKYEGFCFPILESLACGTPVICSRNSCLEEVGGDVVNYIDNGNPKTLAKLLLDADKKTKQDMMDFNSVERHLSNYTWEKCAMAYIKMYENLLN